MTSGLVIKKNIYSDNQSYLTSLPPSNGLTMENLNRKLDRLYNQSSITAGFRLQCLNTTLKFIKDDTRLNIEYPDLTVPQAELISTLILNPIANDNIGFGFKPLYAPLWEALRVFGLKYDFKISEIHTGNHKICLTFEKKPKTIKKESDDTNIKSTPMDTSESDVSSKSDASVSSQTKKQQTNTYATLKTLPTDFVKMSLDKLTDFYNDDATASITFNNLNSNEQFFCLNFRNIMCSNRMRSAFDKNVRIVFEKLIELANSKNNYKLCIKKAKMCDVKDRAVTFSKTPIYEQHRVALVDMDKKENTASNESSDRSVSRESGKLKISLGQPNSVKDDTDLSANGMNDKSVKSTTLYKSPSIPSCSRHTLLLNSVLKDCKNLATKNDDKATPKKALIKVKDDIDLYAEAYLKSVYNPKEHRARERNKQTAKSPLKTNVAVTKPKSKTRQSAAQADQSTDRSVSKERRGNGICFQPGGVLDPHRNHSDATIDTVKTIDKEENVPKERPRSGTELNNRKIKLLEDMSVPLKSDKALKMMQGMGWEGGALGLRGEGITEPIIPALERVSWAGLGHTPPLKPLKPKPRKPTEFRTKLLTAILQLMSSENDQKVLKYQPVLAKKENQFLQLIIDCYSTRTKIELIEEEMALSNQILQLLTTKPDLVVRGSVSPCRSQIHLSKVIKNSQHQPINLHTPDATILHRMAKIESKLKGVLQGDISNMLATLEQDCQTNKLYDLLEFRIEILIYLLEFFKAKESKMTWSSRNELNVKKIRYINYAMETINLGARFGSTEPEIALVHEILRCAGDYRLEYDFFNRFKSFTVTKVYKAKNGLNKQKFFDLDNNNVPGAINRNKISNKPVMTDHKDTDNITSTKSDIDNTKSIELNNHSETTEPVSSSHDVIIIEGNESPIIISDYENDLLQSPKTNPDYESEKTVPDVELSLKCDNLNLEHDLMALEKAIKDADDVKQDDLSPFSKRSRSESADLGVKMSKITKLGTKKVYIVHSNYPDDRLNKVNIQNLQEVISCNILKSKALPLLKCHGVQDGALVYSCHSQASYDWLKNIISVASDIKILDTKEVIEDAYKMSLQFKCYFEFDVDYMFEMLQFYNKGLSTSKWVVLKHEILIDRVCFLVKMDVGSYYYVRNAGYALFAGVDEVRFSVVWD